MPPRAQQGLGSLAAVQTRAVKRQGAPRPDRGGRDRGYADQPTLRRATMNCRIRIAHSARLGQFPVRRLGVSRFSAVSISVCGRESRLAESGPTSVTGGKGGLGSSATTTHDSAASDMIMMRRCIALAQSANASGEYPFAAVIARRGEFICESFNMVRTERDLTRHAEMVAISFAQKQLRSTSLDNCTIYSTIEPCAMCSYAIRESRIGRVVFGLRSPVMGGISRWSILTDARLSSTLPEVFAPPPDILSGCLQHQVQKLFRRRNPLAWQFMKARKIFVESSDPGYIRTPNSKTGLRLWRSLVNSARTSVIDRLWRG
jgi:tRNA(adenine34) deaminase